MFNTRPSSTKSLLALAVLGAVGAATTHTLRIIPGTKAYKQARAAYKRRNRSKNYPFSSTKQHAKMERQHTVSFNGFSFLNTRSSEEMCKIQAQQDWPSL